MGLTKSQQLDRSDPGRAVAKLGAKLQALMESYNALLLKLDADAGVTGTDYSALRKIETLDD